MHQGSLPISSSVRIQPSKVAKDQQAISHETLPGDPVLASRVIVNPGLYDRKRITIRERYLLIKGVLQNQSNVVSVKAGEIEPLSFVAPMVPSHDFH
jgi:hypothetical protein